MENARWNKRRRRIKLIFNPLSGAGGNPQARLMQTLEHLQEWGFIPEVFLIEPDCDLAQLTASAIDQGIRMFVVCGGDGTVSAVARQLVGVPSLLGIVPTGTQNNIALSLGIPDSVADAVALLRTGRRRKVDAGIIDCAGQTRAFFEVCSVGLVSALFPSSDGIQHGKLTCIGEFLTTLAESPPAQIRLTLDDGQVISQPGHVVMAANMPYVGRHYSFAEKVSFQDGLLDVVFFSNLNKLELIGYAIKPNESREDPRIRRLRVSSLDIQTDPPMPVMADGDALGEGSLHIGVRARAITVMGAANTRKQNAAEAKK